MNRRDAMKMIAAAAAPVGLAGVVLLPGKATAGLRDYPQMDRAHGLLREAKKALRSGKDIFGGHRAKAVEAIDAALREIERGVDFADRR